MKKYEAVEIEVIVFSNDSILTTSTDGGNAANDVYADEWWKGGLSE